MHTRTNTQHKGTQSFVSKVQTRRCMQAAKSASPVLAGFFFVIVLFSSQTPTCVFALCARQKRETGRRVEGVRAVVFRSSQVYFFVLLLLEMNRTDAVIGCCTVDKHLDIVKT